ncbi:MAG: class II glutamine amidotransferase [Saccharofermentans sp.]|nr:class II glutamine amidotransferase [Saccharofermentans sp.]
MCELFGLTSDRTIDITGELREFFKHGEFNPHGWGIASWNDKGRITIDKEPVDSTRSGRIVSYLSSGVSCRGIIAHIRKATIGYVEYKNTHPFIAHDPNWREWAFAHNGTIFESDELLPYQDIQAGSTDSERIFLYMLDQNKGINDASSRYKVMDDVCVKLSDKNKLNFFAFDGQVFYVHKNEAGTLYRKNNDGYVFFSTRPLDDGAWEEVPGNRLLVYRDGKQVYEGTVHDHTYVHDEEQMRMIYMGYSAL